MEGAGTESEREGSSALEEGERWGIFFPFIFCNGTHKHFKAPSTLMCSRNAQCSKTLRFLPKTYQKLRVYTIVFAAFSPSTLKRSNPLENAQPKSSSLLRMTDGALCSQESEGLGSRMRSNTLRKNATTRQLGVDA